MTHIEVSDGERVSRTSWVGVGRAQLRVADALFQSAPEAVAGLESATASMHFSPPVKVRGCGRQEILLELVPAEGIIPILQYAYPRVEFTRHPTMNGFYLWGERKDILQIKSEIPSLDRLPFLH